MRASAKVFPFSIKTKVLQGFSKSHLYSLHYKFYVFGGEYTQNSICKKYTNIISFETGNMHPP
jgi:hypothetical protein